VTRRSLFAALTAAPLAAAWFRFVEPSWFEVTHTRIQMPGIRPTRILHISDIHISDGMGASDLEPGFRAGLAARPDVICLTGDYVSYTHGFDRTGLLRLMRLAADSAPTYAVLGNHDGGAWIARSKGSRSTDPMRELLASTGVRVLHNDSAVERDLTLVGIADLWSGELDPERAFAKVIPSAPTVVLCHNPDGKQRLEHHPWNLMLSGHTHGGQARIPGLTPLWAPVVDKRFLAGLYPWEGRQLFITRGLGSPKHVRAFCRPEVSILDLG
jgi:predicted MPP superfamily phosphohydrolase